MNKFTHILGAAAIGLLGGNIVGSGAHSATFDITLVFEDDTSTQIRNAFERAQTFWESKVLGYVDPLIDFGPLVVTAELLTSASPLSAASGTLASTTTMFRLNADRTWAYATSAVIGIDGADLDSMIAGGTLDNVVLHEMAHALGFGTGWYLTSRLGTVYNDLKDDMGNYIGEFGLAAYQESCDGSAVSVPIEGGGVAGTSGMHWAESWACGSDALMTGYLSEEATVSDVTLASLRDLGYVIAPVPLPATATMALSGIAFAGFLSRRRRPRRAAS
ncbi:hypothetical protein BFP70_07935 [Thioclava sp. SK-1]|uniref:leishmanolysin-related zinc metalloendopeptidase n=1 Tax=Thioclava sp. SK-1 TaxID=1889770 RepID=UPI000825C916|nr:leishmanolysin-related zinc metalloendopeptidase [Thioclava sp. SK-1]OCX66038.1 hypothetical protein BFP70_07935 [Thioclava sp. SK-1]